MAAHNLGLPLASVFIAETATDKIPNASPTAASASSDLYGGAISDACAQINERLAPYKAKCGPGASFAVRRPPCAAFRVYGINRKPVKINQQ